MTTTTAARVNGMHTIKSAADQAGLSIRTVRYYEGAGLLEPTRTDSGYRVFGPRDIDRLKLIRLGRQCGLEIETLKELLDTARKKYGPEFCLDWVDDRMADYAEFRKALAAYYRSRK